jgi:hypothetical protein
MRTKTKKRLKVRTPTVYGFDDDLIAKFDIYNLTRLIVHEAATYTEPVEIGNKPGYIVSALLEAVWTRDHAYVLWHLVNSFPKSQRQEFIEHRITSRTDGTEDDPDNGTLPADFVADRIEDDGTRVYKNAGTSNYPFMDGIQFVILALWADWKATDETTLLTTYETEINDCLDAIPTSSNCVYSDPANPSVDYGFTDTVLKTGRTAYGTALMAWSYKMIAEMKGEKSSGTYTTKRKLFESGLATLRKSNGFYMGSDNNNSDVDDYWATALIVAEELVGGKDRYISARVLAKTYLAGDITSRGWAKHLPTGQYWTNTTSAQDEYQNGAYWATPLYDCIRAVSLYDRKVARYWAGEAVTELLAQIADEGVGEAADSAPYEWFIGASNSTRQGYTASLAVYSRFADPRVSGTLTHDTTPNIDDDLSSDTTANYTISGFTFSGGDSAFKANNAADGEYFLHDTSLAADQAVEMDIRIDHSGGGATDNSGSIYMRYVDSDNHIFITYREDLDRVIIYNRDATVLTNVGSVNLLGLIPGDSTYLTIRAWLIDTTATVDCAGLRATGTVTIDQSGKVGGRHGKGATGTGVSYFQNFKAWELTKATLASDVALASDSEMVTAGVESAIIAKEADLIDARGNLVSAGSASIGSTTTS